VSLHTIVSRGIRRPADQRVAVADAISGRAPVRAQLRRVRHDVESMPVLETALALGAIGTAVLLNLAR
jgi:hypothetical protein